MKPGSIVECVRPIVPLPIQKQLGVSGVNLGYKDFVRDIVQGTDEDLQPVMMLYLEGIKNPIHEKNNQEFGYPLSCFRELEPPITNILEHINQNASVRELETLPTLEPELI